MSGEPRHAALSPGPSPSGRGEEGPGGAPGRGEEGPGRAPALQFRDPARARELAAAIRAEVDRSARERLVLMHVCGSHEQAIVRYGLRASLPKRLEVVMGPGCPVCVTEASEIDAAIALARDGWRVLTFGDMLRVPGSRGSLADAGAEGARVDPVYGPAEALALARAHPDDRFVFFASGFETTAVATAAVLAAGFPGNLRLLPAHRYIPPAMQAVAALPGSRLLGFIAAGHAAAITGSDAFVPTARASGLPVVVAGFEPLDLLAAILAALRLAREGRAEVLNAYPRAVTAGGNRAAQRVLWEVFEPADGPWRGLGTIPGGVLRLKERHVAWAAPVTPPLTPPSPLRGEGAPGHPGPPRPSQREEGVGVQDSGEGLRGAPGHPGPPRPSQREEGVGVQDSGEGLRGPPRPAERGEGWGEGPGAAGCLCGRIMTGQARPSDCALFADACTPDHPVGACMVSSEGSCRIWHTYGEYGSAPARPA